MAQLKMVQGDDEPLQFTVRNPDASTANPLGTPANLTGWTLWFTAYPADKPRVPGTTDSDAVLLAHWVAGGAALNISVASLTAGVVLLDLPAATTKALTLPVYNYDVQRKNAAGKLRTIDRGTINVTPETTQRITP